MHHIIDGSRKISKEASFKIGQAIGLEGKSFSYFKDLIAFNQAKTNKEKNFYYTELMKYNKRSKAKLLLKNKYEYFSKWYYNTIREMLPFCDFKGNFALLANAIKPRISPAQAKNAVEVLLKLGLIKKTANDYKQLEKALTTGDEVASFAVQNFHIQNKILSSESIDTCPASERDISCLVVSLSDESFSEIKSEIKAFRKKLAAIADKTKKANRVYHINFDLFPTTRKWEDK